MSTLDDKYAAQMNAQFGSAPRAIPPPPPTVVPNPAASNLTAVQGIPPAQGAEAHSAGTSLGVNPNIILPDPSQAKATAAHLQVQTDLANAPQGVKDFVGASPVNASVAQGSIPGLSKVHNALDVFSNLVSTYSADVGMVLKGLNAPVAGASTGFSRIPVNPYNPFTTPPSQSERAQRWANLINLGLAATGAGEAEAAGAEGATAEGANPPPKPPPHPITGWEPDAATGVVLHKDGSSVTFTNPKEAALWSVKANGATPPGVRLDIINGAEKGTYNLQWVDNRAAPAPGSNLLSDFTQKATADAAVAQTKQMQDTLADTELGKLSPEKTQEAIETHPGARTITAYVNPEALAKVYGEGEHTPFAMQLSDIQAAQEAGREIAIPYPQYLAETQGQPFADALNAATRFGEGGVSVDQGKELGTGTDNPILYAPNPETGNVQTVPPGSIPPGLPGEGEAAAGPSSIEDHNWGFLDPDDMYLHSLVNSDPTIAGTPAAQAALKVAATQAKVAAAYATKAAYLHQLFTEPAAVGMNKEQFALYSVKTQAVQQAIYQKALQVAANTIKRSWNTQWRASYAKHFAVEFDRFALDPAVKAHTALTQSGEDAGTPILQTSLMRDGSPIPYYHGTSYVNPANPEVGGTIDKWRIPEWSSYKVISFAEDKGFASDWAEFHHAQNVIDPATGRRISQNAKVYIVNIAAKNVADFRKPEDVNKAADWYADPKNVKYTQEVFGSHVNPREYMHKALARGSWRAWEQPAMWKDLGWDAARMMESVNPSEAEKERPNISVADGNQVHFRYNPAYGPTRIRLSLADKANYPEALTSRMPRGAFAKGGLPVDEAAEQLGFDTGEDLIRAVAHLEDQRSAAKVSVPTLVKKMAEDSAATKAGAETGLELTPEAIAQAAQNAVSAPQVEDLLVGELRTLSQLAGLPLNLDHVKDLATDNFAQLKAPEGAKPSAFVTTMRQTALRVQAALEKSKWDVAFKEKQNQLINHLQYRMSLDFLKQYNSSRALWRDLAESQQKPHIDQAWMDDIHAELKQYGYDVPSANLEYRRDLWEEQQRAQGFSVITSPPIPPLPVKELTVEEFSDLRSRVLNMVALGKKAMEVLRAGQAQAMQQAVSEAVMGASALRVKGVSNAGVPKRNLLSDLNAEFSQVQPLFDKMDDNNANGVFNQVIRQPAVAAHARANELREADHQHLGAQFDTFTNVEKAGLQRNVPQGHGLTNPINGQEMQLKVSDVLGMAMNMGTELNQWHLFEGGWGWDPEGVQRLLDAHITPKMVGFIEKVHAYLEGPMWRRLADHEFESTGLAPDKPQAVGFTVRGHQLPGGYFPLVRDPERAPLMGPANPDVSALFRDKIIRPSTPTGYLKKRVGAQYPTSLNWQDTLFHHVNDVSMRVAYSEYVGSAMRFIAQQDIRQLLATYGGPNAYGQIMSSLQRETGVSLVSSEVNSILGSIARSIRLNYYLVRSTAKVAIMLEHASAVPQAIQVMGAAATADGYRRWASNPMAAAQFAEQSSAYIRNRHNEIDVNMADLARDMEGGGHRGALGFVDRQLAKGGLETDLDLPFRWTQKGTVAALNWVNHWTIAVPHWTGAYYAAAGGTAKLNGVPQPAMDHDEAVAFADKVVSLAHGSGASMDMSRVQEGYNEYLKLLNVNYSYHGNQLNLTKGALGRTFQGRTSEERAQGVYQVGLVILATIVGGIAALDQLEKLTGPKATWETALSWLTDHIAGGLSRQVPGIRELEEMRETYEQRHKVDWKDSPALEGGPIAVGKGAVVLGDLASGHPTPATATHDLILGASYLAGVPGGGQLANTVQGLQDIGKPGNTHPILGVLNGPYAEHDFDYKPGHARSGGRGR